MALWWDQFLKCWCVPDLEMRPNNNCDPVRREKQWDVKAVVLHDQIKKRKKTFHLMCFNSVAAFSKTGWTPLWLLPFLLLVLRFLYTAAILGFEISGGEKLPAFCGGISFSLTWEFRVSDLSTALPRLSFHYLLQNRCLTSGTFSRPRTEKICWQKMCKRPTSSKANRQIFNFLIWILKVFFLLYVC